MVHKILSINEILTLVKGHNSVENEQIILFNHPNLVNINAFTEFDRKPQINSQDIEHKQNWPKIMCIRYNMDLVFINAYTNFYQDSSICSEDIEENTFLYQSRAITLLFINEFSPFTIPNHSSLISMSRQSLCPLTLNSGRMGFSSVSELPHLCFCYTRDRSTLCCHGYILRHCRDGQRRTLGWAQYCRHHSDYFQPFWDAGCDRPSG